MKNKIRLLFFSILLIFTFNSCKKEFQFKNSVNAVTTLKASSIVQVSAIVSGVVNTDNGSYLVERGICYNVEGNPTTASFKKSDSNPGVGNFSCSLINLTPSTIYYARAYATNSFGTAYGKVVSFTTAAATIPILGSTTAANLITQVSAKSGGEIISSGASNITSKGVCWSSTISIPTIANTKTIDGTGTGTFVSSLIGLTPNAVYYVRAYATNSIGTAYGDVKTFTTNTIAIPTLSPSSISSITYSSAISGGTVVSDGGVNITARGVCWSNTTLIPSIANSKTIDGVGLGTFSSSLTGLNANTTYYVRAYATNSVGTGYGSTTSFNTSSPSLPLISSISASAISYSTVTSGGIISSDGGAAITARGVCWSNVTSSPTIANSKTIDGTGIGTFSSSITGLKGNTTYYVRAYATNSAGTSYGSSQIFKTSAASLPVISSAATSAISYTTATSGGSITSDGGSTITSRGVCWSNATSIPTIANSITNDGTGTGTFSSFLSGLIANTTYNLRAYATNSVGTSYGSTISFNTTAMSVPTISATTTISAINYNSASGGGIISSDGGASVTSRGVCWSSTTSSPTIINAKTTDGSGTGTFSSSITSLSGNTTYYVRAYATNSVGTTYGSLKTFTTLGPPLAIGQNYQGGIVAYIFQSGDSGYIAGETHGIIASTSIQSSGALWGCSGISISGAANTPIGTGLSNTSAIVSGCSTSNIAATLCFNLSSGGYSDWYLPSKDELYKLYLNRSIIGGFVSSNYWSSSQYNSTNGWYINFTTGSLSTVSSKNNYLYVRAIRNF